MASSSPLAGLLKLVDSIGELNAFSIPQNRVFSNLLMEHVLSCTQQMQSLEFETGLDTKSTNIGDLIAATTKGAELLVKILEEQINNGRKDDKQSEYVFERETKDQVVVIKSHIKEIQDAVRNSTVTRFEIHSCSFASLNGVVSPDEMLNHPRTFHTIGNEKPSGRTELLARCVHQISSIDDPYARLKVVLVQGGVGIGKTNFCVSLCRELKLLKPTVRYHLRLRANTDYPMTTLEAMQYVIKTWHVGQMPQSDQKLRALYHQTFVGKVSVLLIEDPSSLRQLLELLPNIRGSRRSNCVVVVSSRVSLDLDLTKHTQGQVDKLVPLGIEEVQAKAVDMRGEEYSFGADDASTNDDESSEIQPEEDPDELQPEEVELKVNVNDDIGHLFGRGDRAVVSVSLIEDDKEADVKFKYPKNYYVLYCPLDKLSMESAEELILYANSELESENVKSLAVLADSLPIFMKAAARTKRLFCDDLSFEEFVDYLASCVNDISEQKEFSKIRRLCQGVFMGCFNKWPIILQKLILRLSVFPNSFHSLDAQKILKVYPLSEIIMSLDQLVYLGVIQSQEPQRYAMHDLVRETFKSIIDEEGGDDSIMVETAKEQYFLFYYDSMTRYNAEHQFSGIEYTPGPERYDLELENMKCVLEFMKDRENDHIEALNRCRYLIRDRIYPLKRGQLYNRLMGYLRSSECELNDFSKSEFLEGFAYVFMDLTDYKQSFKHAHDAFELKENAALLSDRKEDELELLALLQLLGDLCGKMGELDKAKDYYEKVISIATRFSRPWQRIQNEVGATDDDVILDNFLAIAQVAMARMYLNKGDIKNGKKFFEKGITVLRRIFCDVHPELSDAYVQYANVLSNYKNKIFFEEIISLFERALEIDRQLFEEDSRLLGERLEQYGVALLTMGNYGEAEIKLQKAYDIAANYYGEYDPYVAGICNNLAVALKNMKKGEKAEIMYKRSLDITTEVYGPDDYRVSIAKANLSQALIQLGKSEEAQQIFDEALKNLSGKPLEGETATVMASMLSTMGDAMREKKDFTRSIEYFEKALTIQKGNSRGVDKDIEIAKTLASIGRLYFDKGEYKLAEEMQQQSLSIVTNQYGKKHPLYSSSLTSLANTKFKLEKFSEAEKLYNESMEMRKENKEPDANNITTLQALAAVREKEKKWAEAEKMWSQIIAILREMKVRDEPKERTALVALATNMARQQKFNEAETIYSDVLPMVAKEYGDDSIEYADLIYNLGAVYLQLQKFDDAEATFATAKTIYADKLGEDHDRTREVDDQLGEIRHLIYERDMAKRCCGGCLSGCVIA